MLNSLAPLTRSPAELYFAKHEEIRKLVPADTFDQSEEDMIKNFDSRKTTPILVFLGLDESRKENGLTHKIYTGAPTFAVDVTPKGSDDQQTAAKDVISELEAKGLSFFQTRVITTFTPEDGKFFPQSITNLKLTSIQLRLTLKHAPILTGTPATPSAVPAATPRSP